MRFISSLHFWIILGLVGYLLMGSLGLAESGWSNTALGEVILYIVFIGGLYLKRKGFTGITLPKLWAIIAFAILGWAGGMLYEISLFQQRDGVFLPPLPDYSVFQYFLLMQGMYIPLTLVWLFLTRRYRFTVRDSYFAALWVSMLEGVLFNGLVQQSLFSPLFFTAPILIAYYGLAYGAILTLPLVILSESSIWSKNSTDVSLKRKIIYAVVLQFFVFLLWTSWGLFLGKLWA